jgi:broad specificity phosphatase PhoE
VSVSIIYETHSITVDNERGTATGWLPGELSTAGIEAAKELGARRDVSQLDAVFVSDLYRAVQTAKIAFGSSDIPLFMEPRLRECNYGEWNRMPVDRLQAERPARIRRPFPGGESYLQVVARTAEFLEELLHSWDGRTVLLVAHSANRWALQYVLDGTPLEDLVNADFNWQPGWEFTLSPESLSRPRNDAQLHESRLTDRIQDRVN